MKTVDLFLVYKFIRRLATPFKEWDAYDLGIIDSKGKILKSRKSLKTKKEKNAFGVFDLMVLNLKKTLAKAPGGSSKLASYAAALYLIKEWNHFSTDSLLIEDITDKQIQESVELFVSDKSDYILNESYVNQKSGSLNELFDKPYSFKKTKNKVMGREGDEVEYFPNNLIKEEAPTVSVSNGAIAGLDIDTGGPIVSKAAQRNYTSKEKNSTVYVVVDIKTDEVLDRFKIKALALSHSKVREGSAKIEKVKE